MLNKHYRIYHVYTMVFKTLSNSVNKLRLLIHIDLNTQVNREHKPYGIIRLHTSSPIQRLLTPI
jgi:hypothetical protein